MCVCADSKQVELHPELKATGTEGQSGEEEQRARDLERRVEPGRLEHMTLTSTEKLMFYTHTLRRDEVTSTADITRRVMSHE